MDLNLNDHLDHQRWLINNGFINDLHKDTLFMYGSIVHKDVKSLEVQIDKDKRLVSYTAFVESKLLKKIEKYNELKQSASIWGLWCFKRMLKKEGNLDLRFIVDKFVKDYCGPDWSATLETKDISTYNEEPETDNKPTDS
jgi:hypothetical protein